MVDFWSAVCGGGTSKVARKEGADSPTRNELQNSITYKISNSGIDWGWMDFQLFECPPVVYHKYIILYVNTCINKKQGYKAWSRSEVSGCFSCLISLKTGCTFNLNKSCYRMTCPVSFQFPTDAFMYIPPITSSQSCYQIFPPLKSHQ